MKSSMTIEEVRRRLKSSGFEIFIQYYYDFKIKQGLTLYLAERMLNENPKAHSLDAQKTRISKARGIFKSNAQMIALEEVINSEIDKKWIVLAAEILAKEKEETDKTTICSEVM